MSRLAKKPIAIPEKTQLTVADGKVTVKGPLGEVFRVVRPIIGITVEGQSVLIKAKHDSIETKALSGTYASHIKNMLAGVNKHFEKKLIIEGIGFKADVKGEEIVMALGFSHPVKVKIPKGLKVVAEKGALTISGADKEQVGGFSAVIRAQKKPEPYKGKGIINSDEVIRRKQGKKTV